MTANNAPTQTPIDLQDLLLRLRKADAVFDLARGVGHEINNMMQTVVGSLELTRKLIETGRIEETTRFIDKAVLAARNTASLMDGLVGFSRRRPVEPQPLNMNAVIAEIEPTLRAALPRSVKLTFALAAGLWETCCDKHEAQIAVLDLVLQARDAMSAGGSLDIRTRNVASDASSGAAISTGHYVCVSVHGDAAVAATAVDAARAEESAPIDRAGATISTTVVERFASDNGGSVEKTKVSGSGASLMLYLPRHHRPSMANGAGSH